MDEQDTVAQAARRHGFSEAAAQALWHALVAGRGVQAQFGHPELGGMGQWSGGMLQIGDMFNSNLKARVLALCADLAEPAANGSFRRQRAGSHQSQRQGDGSWPAMDDRAHEAWWPGDFGPPASTGAQNDARYAVFPEARRLAVEQNGKVSLYDTGEHRLSGFSQQQSGSSSMAFTSQHGPVRLDALTRIENGEAFRAEPQSARKIFVGGCLCGAVRYEADGTPYHETLCHCTDCRRAVGAPAVAWFTVLTQDFRYTSGAPTLFRSSAKAVRGFCPTCGTSLTFEAVEFPKEIDVTTASLDAPDRLPPRDHCHAASRVSWDSVDDGRPIRPEPQLPKR